MKTFESSYNEWLDGHMNEAESSAFERELTDTHGLDPAAERRRHGIARTALLDLVENTPLPHPDFFNSRLLERIHADLAASAPAPQGAEPVTASWFQSILVRLALGGAMAMFLGVMSYRALIAPALAPRPETEYLAQVLDASSPESSVSAVPIYYKDEKSTVLWLDGMEHLPDSYATNEQRDDGDAGQ